MAVRQSSELAIYRQADTVCYVLLENSRPAEVLFDPPGPLIHRQDIYLGQVRQVLPALDCAFVDIGSGHDGMLPLSEAPENLKPGRPLIVQIKKEAAAGKGHPLTTHIQLPGPYAVFKPGGINKRRSKLLAFSPDEQDRLYAENLNSLQQTWSNLVADSQQGPVPRLLLDVGKPLLTALNSFVSPVLQQIRVEGEDLYDACYQAMVQLMPAFRHLLHAFVPSAGYGLAAVLSLTDLQESLVRRKVWLGNGGTLMIERTEAMTVIDVNSGKDTQSRTKDSLRLRTNLLATEEIARQLRLRNLGGIVVIDFINLENDADRTAVQAALQTALESDRAPCRLLGYTALGLFEMTRTAL